MEAIIASLIGLFGAGLGYFFREYKNRAVPFVRVFEISGGTKKLTDSVKIEESIYGTLEDTFYIKGLFPKSTLRIINDKLEKCENVKEYWPEIKKEIEKLITLKKEEEIIDKLSYILNSDDLKYWILRLLINDKIKLPQIEDAEQRIKVFYSDDKEGEVWITFPGNTISFGQQLNHQAIRAKCEPFITLIQQLRLDEIKEVFGQILNFLDKEYQAAISVIHELQEIVDKESRWIVNVYFANLSKNPIIIHNINKIEIIDYDKTKFIEETYMSVYEEHNGQTYLRDTQYPLVIKPQTNMLFSLISKNVQREMTKGSALRESFDNGKAKCRIILELDKVGLIKKQIYKSKFQPFK